MKVFVSWSGSLSQKVACAFRDWIPCVLQYVRPYVSSEDIDKGTRWSIDIAKELSDSSYGILCITADNQAAPWLNFEAGALSKAIDQSFVTPFLLNLKAAELQNGPLIQFQAATFTEAEVRKLVESINNKAVESERVEPATVKRTFDKWWPELEKDLNLLIKEMPLKAKVVAIPTKQETMIEEILDLARSQQRHFKNPEALLPPDYLEWAFSRSTKDLRSIDRSHFAGSFHRKLTDLIKLIEEIEPSESQERAVQSVKRLHDLFHELEMRPYRSSRRARISAIVAEENDSKRIGSTSIRE
jgi:hypothetical protein